MQDRFLASVVDKFEGIEETSETEEQIDNNDGNVQESHKRFPNMLPKYLQLVDLGYMRLRNVPAVMRYHNSAKKDGHELQYSELLLFTNWRDEEKEFHPDNAKKCIEEYHNRKELIDNNKKAIYPGENTVNLIETVDIDVQGPAHIYDMLDGEGQQQQEDDLEIGPENDPQFESFGYTGNLAKGENTQFESFKYRIVDVPKEEEKRRQTSTLFGQKGVNRIQHSK